MIASLHACAGHCLAKDYNETSAMIPSLEYTALEILAALAPLPFLPRTHMPIFISSFQQDLHNFFMFLLSMFQSGNHHCTVGWRDCRARLICFPWCRDQIVCCLLSNIWKLFNGVCVYLLQLILNGQQQKSLYIFIHTHILWSTGFHYFLIIFLWRQPWNIGEWRVAGEFER